jgi:hypothetical protein
MQIELNIEAFQLGHARKREDIPAFCGGEMPLCGIEVAELIEKDLA